MAFWCYMLRCADGRYYTGHTDDLDRRVGQHRTGGHCKFTSTRLPVELVWCEYFPTRLEALEAERIVGGWSRAKKEALIRGDWKTVSFYARPPGKRVSTMLDTNGGGEATASSPPFASSIVEKPDPRATPAQYVSTTLNTNGMGEPAPSPTPPFVSSPVKKRDPGAPCSNEVPTPFPFASSPVEKPVSSPAEKPVSSPVEKPVSSPVEKRDTRATPE